MAPQTTRRRCLYAKSIPLSSTVLFLSWILPSSTFAQITTSPTPSTTSVSPLSTSSRSATVSTSISPSPTFLPPTQPSPAEPSSTDFTSTNQSATHAFNYYFLLAAVVAILFCVGILWIGRRKKRKAALLRYHGQHALARDVEGWRNRFGVGRAGGSSNTLHGNGRVEGLNERGEAPPPYVPGSKPPSLRSGDGRRPSTSSEHARMQDVELGNMGRNGNGNGPPGYHEHTFLGNEGDIADIRRPDPAVTAHERLASRRLLSNTESSTQS